MSARVVLRHFGSEIEAELAAETLRANGIRAEVQPDRSNLYSSSAYGGTAAIVLVPVKDVALARQLLDTPIE